MLYSLFSVSLYRHSADFLYLYKSLFIPPLSHRICSLCLLLMSSMTACFFCYMITLSLLCSDSLAPCVLSNFNYYSLSYLSLTERTIHSLTEYPLGLKLHPLMASFLSSFCNHHINLWRNIIAYFMPAFTYLVSFRLTTILLCLNIQITLCLLLDFLRLLTVPIPVLVIYSHKTTVIYLHVLKHLGMLFIGKNWDPIMRRISSVPLELDQLVISTLIFLSLLFLCPTLLALYLSVLALSLPLYLLLLAGDSTVSLISRWNSSCFRTADKKPGTTLHYLQLGDTIGLEEWQQIGDWVLECRYILA